VHNEHHDHSQPTHSADCDSCAYVAKIHAHGEEEAVTALAEDLAAHNRAEHGEETDPGAIREPVRGKMQTL